MTLSSQTSGFITPTRAEAQWQGRLAATGAKLTRAIFVSGMVLMPFQVVQLGPAQPVHLWLIFAVGVMVLCKLIRISVVEFATLVAFWAYVLVLTLLDPLERIKAPDQLLKFCLFYPGAYLVGRWLGTFYAKRPLPLNYLFLFALLIAEFIVQSLNLPFIYLDDDVFGQGWLHGTFKERNWITNYILLFSYVLFEWDLINGVQRRSGAALFLTINLVTMVLTGSKTSIVACALVLLLKGKIRLHYKLIAAALGVVFYIFFFATDLSSDKLNERLEGERGAAFDASIALIENNPKGYGLGFVEAYFGHRDFHILGLGEGVNSVFSVPLDLTIIAGPVGLAFWLVFFAGVGLRSEVTMLPIAVLSLLNPLHQSEIIYVFSGILVSFSRSGNVGNITAWRPSRLRRGLRPDVAS